jgi:hypothetical protein
MSKKIKLTNALVAYDPKDARQFCLEQALKGAPVMTRTGELVASLREDRYECHFNLHFPLRGKLLGEAERAWTNGGSYRTAEIAHYHDLFMAPIAYIKNKPVFMGAKILMRCEGQAWKEYVIRDVDDFCTQTIELKSKGLRYKLWDVKLVGKMPGKKNVTTEEMPWKPGLIVWKPRQAGAIIEPYIGGVFDGSVWVPLYQIITGTDGWFIVENVETVNFLSKWVKLEDAKTHAQTHYGYKQAVLSGK